MSDAKSGLELTLDEAAKTSLLEAQWRSETGGRGASPFSLHLRWLLGFPDSSVGKEFACNARDPGLISGSGRSSGERIGYRLQYSWASLVDQLVKNLPTKQDTWVQSLGWEYPLEECMATHTSILAWGIPMHRGAWWAAVHGVAESQTGLND